jgi:tetratricopeptide (TPR) repeat protein
MDCRLPASCYVPILLAMVGFGCQSVGTTTAILYNDQGHYDRAVSAARQVIATNPDDAEAHFQLGLAFSHLDSVSAAYTQFIRAIELDPENARRRDLAENNIQHNFTRQYSRGQAEFERGNYAGAARVFVNATHADPRRPAGYYNLGVSYSRLADGAPGFLDESIDALRTAVKLSDADDPVRTRAMAALFRTLVRAQSWQQAANWGERYTAIEPGDSDVWRMLSECHRHLGNAEQARECTARADAAGNPR